MVADCSALASVAVAVGRISVGPGDGVSVISGASEAAVVDVGVSPSPASSLGDWQPTTNIANIDISTKYLM